jgi:hypothetical protein
MRDPGRTLQGLGHDEPQGQRGGPAERCELAAVPDRAPVGRLLWRLGPHNHAFRLERPARGVQGNSQGCPGREPHGEAKQEPSPTHIPRPSLDRRPPCADGVARDAKVDRDAESRVSPLGLAVHHVVEGPPLVRGEAGEGHAVGDAARRRGRVPHPDDSGFRLNGPAICLEAKPKRPLRLQAFVQLQAGAPFT